MSNSRKRLKGHELFHFTSCPYCIKVRLALWWMGLELPLKDIRSYPENKAELIAGGGKKQVPCLRIEDEKDGVRWMYESSDIIRYLKQQFAS
jgi:glutathione S-transferase